MDHRLPGVIHLMTQHRKSLRKFKATPKGGNGLVESSFPATDHLALEMKLGDYVGCSENLIQMESVLLR